MNESINRSINPYRTQMSVLHRICGRRPVRFPVGAQVIMVTSVIFLGPLRVKAETAYLELCNEQTKLMNTVEKMAAR
jgi:hypothetical protein